MINLTTYQRKVPCVVNPSQVTHVIDHKQGCVIYFRDTVLHVEEDFLTVVGMLKAQ
jgi:hypothetical protein